MICKIKSWYIFEMFRRMHNLDKEVAASGFTKEMEQQFDEVCIMMK